MLRHHIVNNRQQYMVCAGALITMHATIHVASGICIHFSCSTRAHLFICLTNNLNLMKHRIVFVCVFQSHDEQVQV